MFAFGNPEPKTFSTAEAAEDFVLNGKVKNLCEKLNLHVWKRCTRVKYEICSRDSPRGWKKTKDIDSDSGEEYEDRYIYTKKNPSSLFAFGNPEPKTLATAEAAEDFVLNGKVKVDKSTTSDNECIDI